jgi:hypothetical protein
MSRETPSTPHGSEEEKKYRDSRRWLRKQIERLRASTNQKPGGSVARQSETAKFISPLNLQTNIRKVLKVVVGLVASASITYSSPAQAQISPWSSTDTLAVEPTTELRETQTPVQKPKSTQISYQSPTPNQNQSPTPNQNQSPTPNQNQSPTPNQNQSLTILPSAQPTPPPQITPPPIVVQLDQDSTPQTLYTQIVAQQRSNQPLTKGQTVVVQQNQQTTNILIQGAPDPYLNLKRQAKTIFASLTPATPSTVSQTSHSAIPTPTVQPKTHPNPKSPTDTPDQPTQSVNQPKPTPSPTPVPPAITVQSSAQTNTQTNSIQTYPKPPTKPPKPIVIDFNKPLATVQQVTSQIAQTVSTLSIPHTLRVISQMGPLVGKKRLIMNPDGKSFSMYDKSNDPNIKKGKEMLYLIHQQIRTNLGHRVDLPTPHTLAQILGLVYLKVENGQTYTILDIPKLQDTMLNLAQADDKLPNYIVDKLISFYQTDLNLQEGRQFANYSAIPLSRLKLIKECLGVNNHQLAYLFSLINGVLTSENPGALIDRGEFSLVSFGGRTYPMAGVTHPGIWNPNLNAQIQKDTNWPRKSDATGLFQMLSTTALDWYYKAKKHFGPDILKPVKINGKTHYDPDWPYIPFAASDQEMMFLGFVADSILPWVKKGPTQHQAQILYELGVQFSSIPGSVLGEPNPNTDRVIPAIESGYEELKVLLPKIFKKLDRIDSLIQYKLANQTPSTITNQPKSGLNSPTSPN